MNDWMIFLKCWYFDNSTIICWSFNDGDSSRWGWAFSWHFVVLDEDICTWRGTTCTFSCLMTWRSYRTISADASLSLGVFSWFIRTFPDLHLRFLLGDWTFPSWTYYPEFPLSLKYQFPWSPSYRQPSSSHPTKWPSPH